MIQRSLIPKQNALRVRMFRSQYGYSRKRIHSFGTDCDLQFDCFHESLIFLAQRKVCNGAS
jgi:hypothetical protein